MVTVRVVIVSWNLQENSRRPTKTEAAQPMCRPSKRGSTGRLCDAQQLSSRSHARSCFPQILLLPKQYQRKLLYQLEQAA